jgi:hypothetical protein
MDQEILIGIISLIIALMFFGPIMFKRIPEGQPKSLKEFEELISEAKEARARNRTRKLR